ncbi:MAG: hypothetical protein LJE92_18725 [Gammaproteobacteria bacterium]|nr:hypothetical protein [Gammaproteobacteria bacterium]
MRSILMLLTLALLYGCASNKPAEDDTQFITRIGVIKSKDVVELENASGDKKVNTSVHASVSSGGGVSIGLGFLVMAMSGGSSEDPPVRYQVELADGEKMTVYHKSNDFEVDDCVEIKSRVGDDEKSPQMKRLKDGC